MDPAEQLKTLPRDQRRVVLARLRRGEAVHPALAELGIAVGQKWQAQLARQRKWVAILAAIALIPLSIVLVAAVANSDWLMVFTSLLLAGSLIAGVLIPGHLSRRITRSIELTHERLAEDPSGGDS